MNEAEQLWQAIRHARGSMGYTEPELAKWFDHFFPKEPGEPLPYDLTDPRHPQHEPPEVEDGD